MNPHPLSPEEWRQIIAVPAVREAWGLEDDEKPSDFAARVYASKFDLARALLDTLETSTFCKAMHSPTNPPIVLRRGDDWYSAGIVTRKASHPPQTDTTKKDWHITRPIWRRR